MEHVFFLTSLLCREIGLEIEISYNVSRRFTDSWEIFALSLNYKFVLTQLTVSLLYEDL